MFSADRYVEAMRYAATKHNAQKEPGFDLPDALEDVVRELAHGSMAT